MKFRQNAAHLPTSNHPHNKNIPSFHFHDVAASLVTNYFFVIFQSVLWPRPIITSSLLTPRSRDKQSSERGRDKGNVTRISSVWCVVCGTQSVSRAGEGGLIPCHNICQTLAQTIARWRVVTGDNGGLTFYISVLLDISNT